MESGQLFGNLFNTVPLYSEEHLEMILDTMTESEAKYFAIQALVYSFKSGTFTLGESEVVSKVVRILSKNTEEQTQEEKPEE
jgi:hypothetical protein